MKKYNRLPSGTIIKEGSLYIKIIKYYVGDDGQGTYLAKLFNCKDGALILYEYTITKALNLKQITIVESGTNEHSFLMMFERFFN